MEIIDWVWGPDRGLTPENTRLSADGRGEPGQRTVYCQRLILNRNCLTVSNPNPDTNYIRFNYFMELLSSTLCNSNLRIARVCVCVGGGSAETYFGRRRRNGETARS